MKVMTCAQFSLDISLFRRVHYSPGVLVSVVISSDAEKAPFLLVMDAATMKEMGRVVFDGVVLPRGAHGSFRAGTK